MPRPFLPYQREHSLGLDLKEQSNSWGKRKGNLDSLNFITYYPVMVHAYCLLSNLIKPPLISPENGMKCMF